MKLRRGCKRWWILLPAIAIDRITKLLALRYLAGGGAKAFLPGLISWLYVENRGMAFGMANGKVGLLAIATMAVMAALAVYLLLHPDDPQLLRVGLWLVIGGGLGNLWDRLAYGFVVDFIRLDFMDFPVFNVADICVCAGVGLVLLAVVITEAKGKRAHG